MATIAPTPPKRGLLIVVEGLDRSGKTTQVANIYDYLQTHPSIPQVYSQKFPDRSTPTGKLINAYLTAPTDNISTGTTTLSDQAIHLLFSSNRWEVIPSLLKLLLESGTTVIIDRYSFSGAVYTTAKSKSHQSSSSSSLTLNWSWSPEIGLPQPDLVLFLDLDSETAASRGGYGEERYENVEMQARVRELFGVVFDRLQRQEQSESGGSLDVRRIDAGRSVEEVKEEVLRVVGEKVEEMMSARGMNPLGVLGPLDP